MLKRLALLAAVLILIGGSLFFWLGRSPQKKIRNWRQASRFFFSEAGDLATAEKLNQKILGFLPDSIQDRYFQVRILESRGDLESLDKAVSILEELVSSPNPRLQSLNLNRARILRSLGRLSEAQGAARSVADLFPFESNLEMARISLAALDLYGALKTAKHAHDELARDAFHRAQARELEASIYFMLLGYKNNDRPEVRDEIHARAREALDGALAASREVSDEILSPDQFHLWVASLHEKRSRVRAPGEHPCWSAANGLEVELQDRQQRNLEIPDHLYTAIGALKLRAATEEKDDLPDASPQVIPGLLARAQECFQLALSSLTPEEARPLLEKTPPSREMDGSQALAEGQLDLEIDEDLKTRREYILKLLHISKIFLASPLHTHLLSSSSGLRLSERIEDARSIEDDSVSRLFAMVVAFAKLKEGKAEEAEKILIDYARSQEKGLQASAYLDLCQQSLKVLPDQPVALRFIDLYDRTDPEDTRVNRKLSLLLNMKKEPALAEEAQKRIDSTLAALKKRPVTADSDPLARARILQSLDSVDAALDYLRRARQASPDNHSLRVAVGTFLLQQAQGVETDERARELYRQAVEDLLPTLFDTPDALPLVNRQLNFAFSSLQDLAADEDLSEILKRPYPRASQADRKAFLETVRAFLSAEFALALEASQRLERPADFQPFLSLLRGVSMVEVAGMEEDLNSPRVRELLDRAKKEFEAHPELLPNRFELAHLKLRDIPPGQPVPQELLDEVEALHRSQRLKGKGDWLMARALDYQVRHLKSQRPVDLDAVEASVEKIQHHLRRTIAGDPLKTAAYLALSRSFMEVAFLRSQTESQDQAPRLRKEAHEQAVLVLQAVPAPSHVVISKLAGHLISLDRENEAFPLLAAVNLLDPSSSAMNSLMQNLIRNPDLAPWARWALGELEEPPVDVSTPESQELHQKWDRFSQNLQAQKPSQYLLAIRSFEDMMEGDSRKPIITFALEDIREKWATLPQFHGMRQMYIGEIHSIAYQARAGSTREQGQHLASMVQAYEKSLEAYAAEDLDPPLAVLNNLAWYLGVDSDHQDLEKSLELATQAKERLRSPADLPDVYDTYAWILYRNKRLSEAKNEYQVLIAAADRPSYRFNLARVLFDLGDYRGAQEELDRALNSLEFQKRDEAVELLSRVRRKVLEQAQ